MAAYPEMYSPPSARRAVGGLGVARHFRVWVSRDGGLGGGGGVQSFSHLGIGATVATALAAAEECRQRDFGGRGQICIQDESLEVVWPR